MARGLPILIITLPNNRRSHLRGNVFADFMVIAHFFSNVYVLLFCALISA